MKIKELREVLSVLDIMITKVKNGVDCSAKIFINNLSQFDDYEVLSIRPFSSLVLEIRIKDKEINNEM